MASLTIELDEAMQSKLRAQAAQHGRSDQEEAEQLLREVLAAKPEPPSAPEGERKLNAYEIIRKYIDPIGGVDLNIPPRRRSQRSVDFGE